MFEILQHLKFLLTSTNQHGVHSPFIYNYVTKCLYSKTSYSYSKSVNIFLKSIVYFGAKQVWVPENKQLEKIVHKHFTEVRFSENFFSILFLSACDHETVDTMLSKENCIQNDSLLIIDAIYSSQDKKRIWEKIKLHEKVRVTVDMFYCGAVFFRQEQAKEHFNIRI